MGSFFHLRGDKRRKALALARQPANLPATVRVRQAGIYSLPGRLVLDQGREGARLLVRAYPLRHNAWAARRAGDDGAGHGHYAGDFRHRRGDVLRVGSGLIAYGYGPSV